MLEILTRDMGEHDVSDDTDKLNRRLNHVLRDGVVIYKGFLDSEYNTDNSWLEGIVVSYHDSRNKAFKHIDFPGSSQYRY